MIKKLGLTAMTLSALLLFGCGGSDSKSITEQMKERDAIVIIHNTNLAFCKVIEAQIKIDVTNDVITDHADNSVSCATYGREPSANDTEATSNVCIEEDISDYADSQSDISLYEDTTKACVFGMNSIS